ncbi:MAG: hypothetical protein HWN67_14990, partial [Candidatus Helarchaeota archaeon]|nr:hypothetical protein [Candidatus Helarchaeota archaeon]
LMNNNFRVSASTRFLNETIPSLNKSDILVLNGGNYKNYTNQEVNLIVQFVNQGGSIFVLGEHDNVWNMSIFQNKLLENFNMSINHDLVVDNTSYYTYEFWISFNSSNFNLKNITFFSAATMNLSSGPEPIAITSSNSNPSDAIVGAKCEYGEGRIICVTDTQFLWNGDNGTGRTFGIGINIGNNSNFILKIFEWLANKSLPSQKIQVLPEYSLFTANNFSLNLSTNGIYNITANITGGSINPNQVINAANWTTWDITVNKDGYVRFMFNNSNESKTIVVYFFKPYNPSRSILFSEVNFSRRVDQSISGLYNFSKYLRDHNFSVFASKMELNASNFDAVCISNPLQNISNSQISNLLTSNRLLVLGESYTVQDFQLNSSIWNPINSLLLNFGINLTHYLICDNIFNYTDDLIKPTIQGIIPEIEFTAYQSSVVNPTNLNLKIFASGKNSSWGEYYSSLGDWLDPQPLSFDPGDITRTPFIVYNSSVMAIGDTDVITNERGDAPLFFYLEHWLKTGIPYPNIELTPSKESILADNTSTITFTSKIIYDSYGNELDNGTLIKVTTDLGTIITPDEDPSTPGIQISIKDRFLKFSIQAGVVPGIANISAYNFSLKVIGLTSVKFLQKSHPTPEIIPTLMIIVSTLEESVIFSNIILILVTVSIGATLIILLIEKKLTEKKAIIQSEEEIEKSKLKSKKRRRKSKFVRKKL